MHQLLLAKLVKVTLGGIFVKEFCYTSGNHGSFGQNCIPHRKLQNLCRFRQDCPKERLKMQLLKEPAFYVTVN